MRAPHRPARPLVAAIALVLALVLDPTSAGAHVELLESEPRVDERVPEGVEVVTLTLASFDPEEPVTIDVTDQTGADVTAGEPRVDADASTASIDVEPLSEGVHIVHWHAIAEDGDGLSEGTFTFEVRKAQGGGWGIWLVWLFALGVPAAIFLRPGARRGRDG